MLGILQHRHQDVLRLGLSQGDHIVRAVVLGLLQVCHGGEQDVRLVILHHVLLVVKVHELDLLGVLRVRQVVH